MSILVKTTQVAMLGVALAGAFIARPAAAQMASYDLDYYSDATYENQVGNIYRDCSGQRYKWGQITDYVIMTNYPC